jgi:hypothetical protein
LPKFSINSPKSSQVKKGQNIYNKAQFEGPKHLQTTETAYLGENLINLIKQKVAIVLGYFIVSKNHKPPKVAALVKKIALSAHPGSNESASF